MKIESKGSDAFVKVSFNKKTQETARKIMGGDPVWD